MIRSVLITAALAALSGCASIIEGSTDNVQIVGAPPPSHPTTCSATNERGTWSGFTPGSVTVKKSRTDLHVSCRDPRTGYDARGTLVSDVEAWAFGNILFGGLIGLGIDWGTGAAYDYPESVTLTPAGSTVPAVTHAPATSVVSPVPIAETPAPTPYFTPAPGMPQPLEPLPAYRGPVTAAPIAP